MSLQRGKQGTICKPHELGYLSRERAVGEQVHVDYDLGDFAGFRNGTPDHLEAESSSISLSSQAVIAIYQGF